MPLGALQNASDIFTRRRREDELRARLAAVIECSDDAIITTRLDGVIDTWNNGAERMFGYAAQEVAGKSITILIPPERVNEEAQVPRSVQTAGTNGPLRDGSYPQGRRAIRCLDCYLSHP